jgi:competence protein ComEC
MKRPLGLPCLLFIGGILFAELSGWSFPLFLGSALLLVLTALFWPERRLLLLAAGIGAAGAAALALQTHFVAPNDLRKVAGGEACIVTLRGKLAETPYQRFYEDRSRSLTKLECAALRLGNGDWQEVAGTVAVVTTGTLVDNLWHGQRVEVTGVLTQPPLALAPGLFEYRGYLRRLGIHHTLRAASEKDWRVFGSTKPPLSVRFSEWAKRTLARGLPREDDALQLLWAMTLGWKTALSGETSEPFMRSGTLHVFAISGLHIAMIAAIIAAMLRAVRIHRQFCALIVIPIIWFYTYATGWQASAVRSAVMATVVFGSWIFVRPPDLFNSLAGAALIILAYDPQQLFQAGFQLSFSVVFCLALFGNYFRKYQHAIASGDPLVPWELRPWWQRAWLQGISYTVAMAITAVAAWLASIPLTAYYFHLFSPVSVLANLIVVPLSGAALASNVAALFFGGWFPWLTEILNNSAWFWMKAMLWVSEWMAGWPGAALHVSAPGPFSIALYYLVLIALASGLFSRAQLRRWMVAAVVVVGIGSIIEVVRQCSQTTLTVLPLSGGHAVFVDRPGTARDMLVDCGDQRSGRLTVKPFLQSRGVRQLPQLALTHGDAEHVGGLETISEFFQPQRIFTPISKFRSPIYREALRIAGEGGGEIVALASGDQRGDWEVLHPAADDNFPYADDKALILRGTIAGTRVLLLPDASPSAQSALMERGADLRSDVVIASISPAGEPLGDALLDRIKPRVIVVADALFPPEARARPALRKRLNGRGCPIFYTSETGAITVGFKKDETVVVPTWGETKPIFLKRRND